MRAGPAGGGAGPGRQRVRRPGPGGQGGLGQDLDRVGQPLSAGPPVRGAVGGGLGFGQRVQDRVEGGSGHRGQGGLQVPHPVGVLDQVGLPGPLLSVLLPGQPLGCVAVQPVPDPHRRLAQLRRIHPRRRIDQQGLGLGPGDLVDGFALRGQGVDRAGEHTGVGGREVPSSKPGPGRCQLGVAQRLREYGAGGRLAGRQRRVPAQPHPRALGPPLPGDSARDRLGQHRDLHGLQPRLRPGQQLDHRAQLDLTQLPQRNRRHPIQGSGQRGERVAGHPDAVHHRLALELHVSNLEGTTDNLPPDLSLWGKNLKLLLRRISLSHNVIHVSPQLLLSNN